MSEVIHIKNMVCPRCINTVSQVFHAQDIPTTSVELGAVGLTQPLSATQKEAVASALKAQGFELLEDKNAQLITRIKTLVIQQIHQSEQPLEVNFSTYLSQRLGHDYSALSRLFSSVEGITLEKYVVRQRIERVKELLFYGELTLSEIAYRLHYSSVAHLSAQFKKETGMSPSVFRQSRPQSRKPLDAL